MSGLTLTKDTHFSIGTADAKKLVKADGTSKWVDAGGGFHNATLDTTNYHGTVTFTLLAAGVTAIQKTEFIGTYTLKATGTDLVRCGALVDGKYVGANTEVTLGTITIGVDGDGNATISVLNASSVAIVADGSGNYVFPVVNYSIGPKYEVNVTNFDDGNTEYGTVSFTLS